MFGNMSESAAMGVNLAAHIVFVVQYGHNNSYTLSITYDQVYGTAL